MSSPLLIDERKQDRLLIATINRPEAANAVDPAVAHALTELADRAERAEHIDAVILTGTGRTFCSGGDVALFGNALRDGDALPALLNTLATTVHGALQRLTEAGPLLVGAINGAATGAGLGMVCACDVAIARPGVKLRAGFSRLGLSPDTGTTWFLPRRVGERQALAMLLDGEPVAAEQALSLGLIDAVFDGDDSAFLDAVIERTRALIAGGAAVRQTRRLLRASRSRTLTDHLADEQATLVKLASSTAVTAHLRNVFKLD